MAGEPRATLRDAAGDPLATYVRGTREGHPLADELEAAPGVGTARLVAAILAALPGHVVGSTEELGDALVRAGAEPWRRATVMSRDARPPLDPTPATPAGLVLAPVGDRGPDDLLEAIIAAYPPGHPDHRAHSGRDREREDLRGLLCGDILGPLLACSRVALAPDARVVGAVLVNDAPGTAPFGGPWIGELFRAPWAPAGTGAALLAAAIDAARRAGVTPLSLVVTDGNPAIRVYERLGFRALRRFRTVLVPETGAATRA